MSTTSAAAEQVLREQEDARRAREREQAWLTRAKVYKLSRVWLGRQLIRDNGEALRRALNNLVSDYLEKGEVAGRHYNGLQLLMWFSVTGFDGVTAKTLRVVVDALTRGFTYEQVCSSIGLSVMAEARAGAIHEKNRDLPRWIVNTQGSRKHVYSRDTLVALKLDPADWTREDRKEIGGLLLDLVLEHCDLCELESQPRGTGVRLIVRPLEDVAEQIRVLAPDWCAPRRRAMVCPPRPWRSMRDGGLESVRQPLVVGWREVKFEELGCAVRAVNALQQQELCVDQNVLDMAVDVWERWDEGGAGRLYKAETARGKALVQDRLQEASKLGNRSIWFAYEMDYRGRIYTQNRVTTHQGPDSEKGLIQFMPEVVDDVGMKWLRRCMAGHWSKALSHATWEERETWRPQEDWESAEDPFQYLQAYIGWQFALKDVPTGAPCRLDQTCSGLGVIAALMRDEQLAERTNMIGDHRMDVYEVVAERVIEKLRYEMETAFDMRDRKHAKRVIPLVNRSFAKKPVMAFSYGAGWESIFDWSAKQLHEQIEKEDMRLRPQDIERELLRPARLGAKALIAAMREELGSVVRLRGWLGEAVRPVIKAGKRFRFTTPSGMRVELLGRYSSDRWAATIVEGRERFRTCPWDETPELSANEAVRGACANLIHSFDAAVCHLLVCRAADLGVPLLTNHDCFAVHANHASWLHRAARETQRDVFGDDWLRRIKQEVEEETGMRLPALPEQGRLAAHRIGENPYLYS